MSDPKISIYTLSDPRTGAIRYVGHTKNSLEKRLYWHKTSPINMGVSQWLYDLSQVGLAPVASVVEIVDWEDRYKAERRHRDRLIDEGCELFNRVGNRKYWEKWRAEGNTLIAYLSRCPTT